MDAVRDGAVVLRLTGRLCVVGPTGAEETPAGRKARRLLALLAVHRPRTVPMFEIVDVLWDVRPPRSPEDNVATLVSRLRAAHGPSVVLGRRSGYRLGDPPWVRVDLDVAAELVARCARLGPVAPARALEAGRSAVSLLAEQTVLVGEPDEEWVRPARTFAAGLLREARHAVATAALRGGEPAVAAEVAEDAAREDPLDEIAHRLLMQAYRDGGEPARALVVYERLRVRLDADLGVPPAPDTRAVHAAVLAGSAGEKPGGAPGRGSPRRSAARPVGDLAVGELAGRDAELAVLDRAWSAARGGRAAVVLVSGEGGIGKTRLAAELAARAEATGGLVLRSRCFSGERSLFLQPLVDALAAPLERVPAPELRVWAGPQAGVLGGLFPALHDGRTDDGGSGSSEADLRRICDGVVRLLRGLAADRPLLLLLDDLHHSGLATVELIHHLARHLRDAPVLIVATLRTEEGGDVLRALADVSSRVELGPLDTDAVTALAVAAGVGDRAGQVARRTRGHTLFVVETVRALAAGTAGVPESLRTMVVERLERAGPGVRDVLRAGAVLGAAVDPVVVAGMLDLAPIEAVHHCEDAVAACLLGATGQGYAFVNDLVRESLYADTPAPVRAQHHRRAADLLPGQPEIAAEHASAAEDWTRAARGWLLAGDRAMRNLAAADAESLLERALDAADRAGDAELAGRAHLARVRCRESLAAYRGAVADARVAVATARRTRDPRLEMLALRELGGHVAVADGVPVDECERSLTDALRIAEGLGDREVQARVLGWHAVLATNRLRLDDAVALGLRAVAAGRRAGPAHALAVGLDGLKSAYAYLGASAPLRSVADELIPLLRDLDERMLLLWAVTEHSHVALGEADWDTADRQVADALEACRNSGEPGHLAWIVAHQAWMRRLRGDLDGALETGRAAVAQAAAYPHRWFGPAASAGLAVSLVAAGRRAEAVAALEPARGSTGPGTAEAFRVRCAAPLALASGDAGVLAEADALLDGVRAPRGDAWLLGLDSYLCVAQAWREHGRPDRSRAVLAPLLTAARGRGWVPALVLAGALDARAACELGEPDASVALATAAALGRRHGIPVDTDERCDATAIGLQRGSTP